MALPEKEKLREIYRPPELPDDAKENPLLLAALKTAEVKPHIYLETIPDISRTVSLLCWLKPLPGEKAWLSFTSVDNAPEAFWNRLGLSFLSLQPDNRRLRQKLEAVRCEYFAAALTRSALHNLAPIKEKYVLIMDNFQLITDERIIRGLVDMIKQLTPGFSVIIAGKNEPHALFSDLILREQMSVIQKDLTVL